MADFKHQLNHFASTHCKGGLVRAAIYDETRPNLMEQPNLKLRQLWMTFFGF
jgi:hypothetical protein